MGDNSLQPDQQSVLSQQSFISRAGAIADALQDRLINVTPLYAKQPIQSGFNWSEAFTGIEPGEWYLVVFRSQHRADADEQSLDEHDRRAFEAARRTPGFMHYFGGTPTEDRACLSFCLWENQGQAKLASAHEAHQTAAQLANSVYESFQLERYIVRNTADGVVQFVPLHSYSQAI
jgi:hypothetical protein